MYNATTEHSAHDPQADDPPVLLGGRAAFQDVPDLAAGAELDSVLYALARSAEADQRSRWWAERSEYWLRRARAGG